jgi:hypothetical protein
MGEVALCRPLRDPQGVVADLKALALPYPDRLQEALIRRFQWEALFSIENAATAAPSGDETYIAGCAFRALACVAQVLFALNRRYLINEKGAIEAAAQLTLTIPDLSKRAASVWRAIGTSAFGKALAELRSIECELKRLTAAR